MFARFSGWLRRQHWAAQLVLWPVYVVARLAAWIIEWFTRFIQTTVGSYLNWTVSGSFNAVLAKVAALLLVLGMIAAAAGAPDVAAPLVTLAAAPIILMGLAIMVKAPFSRPAKKKKKK